MSFPSVSTAPARDRDGRAVVASRSKFARGAELGRRVGAQSRGAQTNPPRDARAANECLLSGVIRTTFVGPDAFFNSRRNWPTSRRAARSLFCAVGAIAGIPQTWDNEPSLIESVVDGRSPETNIGMKPTHSLHSLLSGNQTDETDVFCSTFLDTINGGSGCITSCQHRRHDDDEPLRKVGTSCEKIRARTQTKLW